MSIDMRRDDRDVWPDDVPIGTFDIDIGGPEGYEANAHIIFVCPNNRRCAVLLGPVFVERKTPDALCVWQWDGNTDKPTIKPSINCIAEKDGKPTGGCGAHFFIINGEMQ